MSIEVTEEAVELLKRSLDLAGLDPERNGVRLRGSRGLGGGFDVQVEMADEPLEGEDRVSCSGITFFIDPQVREAIPEAVVAVEPQHEILVVRPAHPAN